MIKILSRMNRMEQYSNPKPTIKNPDPNISILIVTILSILYTLHYIINTYAVYHAIHEERFAISILNFIQTIVSTFCMVIIYLVLYLYIRNFRYRIAEYLSLAIIFIYITNTSLTSIFSFHYDLTLFYMIYGIVYAAIHIGLGISLIISKIKIDYVGRLYVVGIVILIDYIGKVSTPAIIASLLTVNGENFDLYGESFDLYSIAISTSRFFFSMLLMISILIVLLKAKKFNRNEILINCF